MNKVHTLITKTLTAITLTTGLTAATTGIAAPKKPLEIEVFASDAAGFHATSTLIKGEKDAILVDAQFTLSAAHRLTAQIIESGKELKTVFITHAHPDHYFGLEIILNQFPNAKVVATKDVVDEMRILGPEKLKTWKPLYGSNLTSAPLMAEALTSDTLILEGEELKIIELKGAEIENTAIISIPSIKTVIAGDLVYSGVHPWLAETDSARRKQWLNHLKTISALNPKIVVAGHQAPGAALSTEAVNATKRYIETFERVVAKHTKAESAKKNMMDLYPNLALPVILDFSIQNAFSTANTPH